MKYLQAAQKRVNHGVWQLTASFAPVPSIQTLHSRIDPMKPSEEEWVRLVKAPSRIEPEFGYAVTMDGALIEDSWTTNYKHMLPTWRIGTPSALAFAKARAGLGNVVTYPRVISLRTPWEWNYFHFCYDVLGKLALFDECGVPSDTPLVLGDYATRQPFVQQIINKGRLASRNWIVQKHAFVRADSVYLCRTRQTSRRRMDYVADAMDARTDTTKYEDRVFLTRQRNAGRKLSNTPQVESTLRELGFMVFDADGEPIERQIEVLSRTRFLVALHGAGILNIMFRRGAPLSVLELVGSRFRQDLFRTICSEYGYWYDDLVGPDDESSAPANANFLIDPDQLRIKVLGMIAAAR